MLIQIIDSILPIFIIIFIGWLAGYLKIVGENAHKTCAKIVTVYVFPALLFMQTATARPEQIFDLRWMSAFLISIAIIWAICFSASIFIFKESKKNSVMQAMINTFTDMGGMGIPFFMSIIGSAALISVAKANFVISLTLIPLTIFLLELYSGSSQSKKGIILYALSQSLKKPMFLAVVLGAIISLLNVYTMIPKPITDSIDHASKACVFMSLFTVGLALYGIRFHISKMFIFNVIMKSLISGFIAWGVVILSGITGDSAKELVYLVAMPTATIATIFALQWRAIPDEATSLYLVSTVLSIITLPMWMFLLG